MRKYAALFVLLLFGCGGDEPQAKPPEEPKPVEKPKPVEPPKPPKPNMAPPLTDAQNAALQKDFATARAFAKDADKLKADGDALMRSGGPQAANDTYVEAREKYKKACDAVSDWIDGDLAGKVTDAQVNDYLGSYVQEVGHWQKAMGAIGKVHKND